MMLKLFSKKNKKKQKESYSMNYGVSLLAHDDPTNVISEQFNTIRTNIQFSSVDTKLHSILFTSAAPSEGKSTVSANLAVSWAKQDEKVILIDADLRKPTIHKTFNQSNQSGLSNYLLGSANLDEIVKETKVPNLYVITSGPIPPNPSEILASKRIGNLMEELQNRFDLLMFDAPPVNSVTDAQVLATKIDGTILVTPQGVAEKHAVAHAKKLLDTVHANILGAIVNQAEIDKSSNYYGGYYGIEQ